METRSQRKRKRSMPNLTEDLIIEILICLPLMSIIRFRSVCKSWYKLLDLNFLSRKLHFDIEHQNFRLLVTKQKRGKRDYEYPVESKSLISNKDAVKIGYPFKKPRASGGIRFLGSFNGLVCAHHSGYIFYVWNPCTTEYKVIRSPFGYFNKSYGFGYDSRTHDYKLICCQQNKDVYQVEIYTLGLDSWKTYNSDARYRIREKYGVFLNGAVHWFASLRTSNEARPSLIISVDLEDGEFKEIPQPEHMDNFNYKFVNVLRGRLCLLCSVSNVGFEIWEMKDYGIRESWSKLFKTGKQLMTTLDISSFRYLRSTVSLKDGEILLEIIEKDGECWYRERVNVVKMHLEEAKRYATRRKYGYMKDIYQMEAYVESLVSVNSGTFVGNELRDNWDVLQGR